MQRSDNPSAFDHATMEQLMERYRSELLSYQRATPPGKPTLAQMQRETAPRQAAPAPAPPPPPATAVTPPVAAPPTAEIAQPTAPILSNPTPLALTKTEIMPETTCAPHRLAGFAAGIAADLTAGIFAAVLPEPEPVIVAEATAVEISEEAPMPDRVETMRATLAQSLANIGEARVARLECAAGCRTTPEEQEENAPSRRRVLLPDETAEPHTCPCNAQEEPAVGRIAPPTPPVILPDEENPPPNLTPIPPPGCLTKPAPPYAIPGSEGPPLSPMPMPPPGCLTKPTPPPADCLCCGHTEYEKGIGAYGTFRSYERWDHLTRAAFLQKPGEATQVLARFAADVPMGGADACRCRRSFSVKFLCKGDEYDLLGQHLPVTVGCEQQAVLACCSTTRADPVTGLRSRSRFWEYTAANPIALHAAVWLYSDLGTIGSYRAIDGYSLPALWTPTHGKHQIARCCWLSRQRPQTLTRFESEELCGYDPDAVARDFVTAINRGDLPQYELAVQLLDPDQQYPFDPFDPTLLWPQEIAPLRRLGLMTLERLPERLSPDLDANRFSAGHLTEGILAAPPALPAENHELEQAGARLRGLGERERRRLIDNLCDDLSSLPADLLEQVLILFSRADLGFGQALTAALGG